MGITHEFVSAKSDGADATKVQPSNWNEDHVLSGVGFGNVRQSVISGPVNTNGHPSFGGSTGSGTVTASGTIIAAAANGADISGAVDRVGLKANPSWTGLTTNGTMYLYVTVNSDGTLTEGSTTVAPVYQFGGTPAVTSGLFTFNISEMVGYLGNGSSAAQAYRVYVGEVTVAGSVVTAITWYALNGRYVSTMTNTLLGVTTFANFSHNLGTTFLLGPHYNVIENITTDAGFPVGSRLYQSVSGGTTQPSVIPLTIVSHLVARQSMGDTAQVSIPYAGGGEVALTAANWKYGIIINRGW